VDILASDDQKMLQDMTRRFLEERSPIGALRRSVQSGAGFDAGIWREGAGLGWTAIFVPEEFGGISESGEGAVDAAIIAEELGRVVYSGPFLPVSVVSQAVAKNGSRELREQVLPKLVTGEKIAAWCFAQPGRMGALEPGGLTVRRIGLGWILDGRAVNVEEAAIADYLLVTARDGEGLTQFLVPSTTAGVTIEPLDGLDLGRRLANVQCDGILVRQPDLLGEAKVAADQVEAQLQLALVLQCAETVGVASRALEFTLEWVEQRIAFNRPIGSFQALKHRLAEHATQLEGAKAITAHAARAVQTRAKDAAAAVSVAKSQCGRYATQLIRDCLQMHGGIGMTWEHDIHFYLRRAVSNEALWGAPPAHHERLCRLAGL
jgi:alkylation response protein AidB-like acyl-CoA dehydrogenase